MGVRSVVKIVERYMIDNSPTLLTALGVTGTLTTAYLTGKATFRAADIISEEKLRLSMMEKSRPLENKDKAKLVWKCYIPPAISIVTTIGCVVTANTISTSRMAALAAAYAISDKNFSEYKEKVREFIGDKKAGEVRTAVAQDTIDQNPPGDHILNPHGGGEVLCYDKWTGRYFRSDMQTIRAAENDINKGMIRGRDVATLGDFYEAIGLTAPKCAEEVGWNSDSQCDLVFDTVLATGNIPCLVVDFANTPFPIRTYFGQP